MPKIKINLTLNLFVLAPRGCAHDGHWVQNEIRSHLQNKAVQNNLDPDLILCCYLHKDET